MLNHELFSSELFFAMSVCLWSYRVNFSSHTVCSSHKFCDTQNVCDSHDICDRLIFLR